MSKEEKTKDAVVVDEWRLFACATLPKPCPEYDEIIKQYIETREEKYYDWLLAAYEPRLNKLARLAVEGYGMYGHFADIKMVMALGMHKALQSYDPALGVPFMIYKNRFLKSEVPNYIRTMRTGYSVPTAAKMLFCARQWRCITSLAKSQTRRRWNGSHVRSGTV